MKFLKKSFIVICFFSVLSFLLFRSFSFARKVNADEYEDKIKQLDEQISEYQNQITVLKNQSVTLQNQIAQFDTQIKLTTLKIERTEEKILLLSGRIDRLEVSLDVLSNAFSSRAVETYKMFRFDDPFMVLISSPDLKEAMTRFQYLKKIQDADRDLLERLQSTQTSYVIEKTTQEELQEELESEKLALDNQKKAKNSLLSQTKNDEKKYQELLAQAQAQKRAFSRYVSGQGGASLLGNQTFCDGWGCYYNQRDSSWGNTIMGVSGLTMAEYGCLVTSVSMIASHYGKNIKPSDIANNSSAFVYPTAYLSWSFNVNGINVSITSASISRLDSELSAGRPVIAGLYSGPDHFIVIKEKQGDNYIMYDPFLPNGYNKNLTEKYSVGNISSLRLVSFP
ncbi:C39 family peptidase [Patescibacteria group bacterium]|nr:C39 family peptidase [Patescibacteria group bacterium]MBU2036531.1 C39 family peptidase [Patescibacteria group bacterium]